MKTVLILGATGGIGGEIARALADRGWQVRAMARKIPQAQLGYEWVTGDAMHAEDVLRAAAGARVIVHAVNPPSYQNWPTTILPMLENSLEAAAAVGARIVVPGSLYHWGPIPERVLSETTPARPVGVKSKIRLEQERRLVRAAAEGVSVLTLRCGDFFGPSPGNNAFSQGLVKPGQPVQRIYDLTAGAGHTWAYLPDVGETIARLLESGDRLPHYADFNFEGQWDHDGRQLTGAIAAAVGSPVKVTRFPWWAVRCAAPFVPFLREMNEMRYLWKNSYKLDNRRLVEFLGEEPRTPLGVAVKDTLRALRCLPS